MSEQEKNNDLNVQDVNMRKKNVQKMNNQESSANSQMAQNNTNIASNNNGNKTGNKKNLIVFVCTIVGMALVIGIGALITILNSPTIHIENDEEQTEVGDKKDTKHDWYTPKVSDKKVDIYYSDSNAWYGAVGAHFSFKNEAGSILSSTYYCKNDCEGKYIDEKGYAIIKEENDTNSNYTFYDFANNKAIRLDYSGSYDYRPLIVEKNNKIYGIIFRYYKSAQYIPVIGGQIGFVKCRYETGLPNWKVYGEKLALESYDSDSEKYTIKFFDLKNGKEYSDEELEVPEKIKSYNLLADDNNIYFENQEDNGIYDSKMNLILKDTGSDKYPTVDLYNNMFLVNNYGDGNRYLRAYDKSGNEKNTINNVIYSNVNYAFTLNGNKLELVDIVGNKLATFDSTTGDINNFYAFDGEDFPTPRIIYNNKRERIIVLTERIEYSKYKQYLYNLNTKESSIKEFSKEQG